MFRLIFALALLQIAGCSSSTEPLSEPTTVTYSMLATQLVNPNLNGDGTPIEVQVFELEDDSMFLSSDYEHLARNAKTALKSNYVDHKDFVLIPGQFKFINSFELEHDTRYIAIMGRFADPDRSEWKKVIKVLPQDHEYHLLMYINENEIILDKVE
ncbi:type VI secretion system lipoprotein TssJ [Enterovibrio sp. ZSDZ35]|uniref:Type VI secretion system lipoprotein TssJ n=1 Tax=Enterovibrio qingdaonensis TaxID=2899818 RepID=A0ABT5QHQ1_9GAMM|nr:type VI secretion system lipoprotein TssJ [Enterovibrio sp. ZSDZ35]MDD1780507.1 type VI secretion system lipoprotein TssJ [Enterovibrio sp. ZSDZ35]